MDTAKSWTNDQFESRRRSTPTAESSSTWYALRNPVFCRLWLASVLSGTFVSAQDVAATWLMHDLGASSLALSLMATAASAPFFLFTLPAGAVADIVNRRAMIVSSVLWQGACLALLALGAWTDVISTSSVLACIFALGIGLAFSAPVWGAIVPDVVSKEELPSAVTLGGVQLNLSGIVGPALGGLMLPLLGASLLISVNALAFLVVALVVLQWKPRQLQSARLRENFTESFITSLRYARNSQRMKTILFRNLLFSVVISIIPALLPVIALRELGSTAAQLGLVFACVGVGSLAGAMFVLPYLRERISPNAIISIAMATIAVGTGCDGVHPPSTCFDGIYDTCGRGLGAGGIRAVGGWAACNARMGARTNEFVPDNAGTRQHGGRGSHMGDGSSICRSRPDLCCRGCCCPRWVGPRASIFNQLRHGSQR